MAKEKNKDHQNAVLTERMDIGSKEFSEFQAIILNQSREQSEKQKRKVELLALKFRMEDYVHSNDMEIKNVGYFLKNCLTLLGITRN